MTWTSYLFDQLCIIVMYFFQGVTLFSTRCLSLLKGRMTGEIPLPEQMKRTKHTHGQTHTHTKTRQNRKHFSWSLPMCISVHPWIHWYLLSPTQAFFFLFKWWILNFIPVDRSTVSLENKLFLGRIGERWCWVCEGTSGSFCH